MKDRRIIKPVKNTKGKRKKFQRWICRLIINNELDKAYLKTSHKLLKWYDVIGLRAWIEYKKSKWQY